MITNLFIAVYLKLRYFDENILVIAKKVNVGNAKNFCLANF